MTNAQYKAAVAKRDAEFAKADRRARRLMEHKSDIERCRATAPGFSILIAPGILLAYPKLVSNVVSLDTKRAQRKALSERAL
jgi:hypothetical protein